MDIKKLRESKEISQIDMAKMLKIPVSTYNVYENGNRRIPVTIAKGIAKILSVGVDDIFLPASFTVSKTTGDLINPN